MELAHYRSCLVSFFMIFDTILFIIQIRELALSDITSCGESNMAASAKKFDIRAMIGEIEAYIVYAGPARLQQDLLWGPTMDLLSFNGRIAFFRPRSVPFLTVISRPRTSLPHGPWLLCWAQCSRTIFHTSVCS